MPEYMFGSGNPDAPSFPVEELIEATATALRRIGSSLVLYPDQKGYLPLRQLASERFRHTNDIELPVERIALATGSMQAINLVCQTYIQPGDTIIVEEYCYVGSLNAFRKYRANMVGIKVDDDGMDMDDLAAQLSDLRLQGIKPKFIYTIATNQNPTGTMMPEHRRRKLLELARVFDVPVVDDDCYADLIFEGKPPISLYSLDPDSVIYIGSFSKILGPGVRLGYFAAREDTLARLLYWKIDGGTSNLAAAIAAEYFKDHMWGHIEDINGIVKEKLDAVVEQLDAHKDAFPYHSSPKGGLFIWVKLPEDVDVLRLQEIANARGMHYGTGKSFHTKGEDIKYLRLAFGYPSLQDIREGIPLLADCVREARAIAVKPSV